MKLYGSITELVSAVFRKNSQTVTVRPNQTTTYTAARDVQLPEQDTDSILVSRTSSDILTNKTLISPSISSPVLSGTTTGTFTLTGATIDGDNNTLQDIGVASLKTVLGDANEVILRNASGVVTSALLADANVDAAAGISRGKLGSGSANHVVINGAGGAFSSEAQLAVTRGGTGQSTALAAFDALSPTSAKGDLIAHDGSTSTALAAGTNGFVLKANSATASGLEWAAAGSGDITNGGNTTGGTIVIGTNDVQALEFETSGVSRLALSSGGSLTGSALATITTVGALNSGSITSGFGSIDIGSDALTAGAGTFTSATGSTSVITPLLKAYDGNGLKFQENGGTEIGSATDAGAWTFGASVTSPFLVLTGNNPTILNTVNTGQLVISGGNTAATSGGGQIVFYGSGDANTGLLVIVGSNQTERAGTNNAVNFNSYSAVNTEITAGYFTGAGAWTFGPSGGLGTGAAAYHTLNGSIVGNISGGRGIYSSSSETILGTNMYRDGSGTFKAVTTGGVAALEFVKKTTGTDTAISFYASTTSQTADTAVSGLVEIAKSTAAGAWTLGSASGMTSAALVVQGWSTAAGASSASNGEIKLGVTASSGARLQHNDGGTTHTYLDNRYDSASSQISFRLRTDATPVTAINMTGAGVVTLGDTANTAFTGNKIVGRKDGSAVPAGFIGEVRTFTQRTVATTAGGDFEANATALDTLTAGRWQVFTYAQANITLVTALTATIASNGTSDGTGLLSRATIIGQRTLDQAADSPIMPFIIDVATTQPLFAKANTVGASGNVNIGGYAVRIA